MKKMTLNVFILFLVAVLTGCANNQLVNEGEEQETNVSQASQNGLEISHEHSYVESITVEATCTKQGEKKFTCDCGDAYTEVIDTIEHAYVEVAESKIEATCTTEGKEADMKCSICGDIINGTVIEAFGHNFEEYISNGDATYISDGTETATCVCGETDTRTEEGSKLEYTYTEINKTMYATSSVNLRDLPSSDGNKVGKLSEGDQVTVVSKCNETNWYGILQDDKLSYVSNKYLSEEKPEPTYDLGDGIKRKYGVLYVNTCGKNLTNEPVLCESLGPFPYPLHTLIDNGDGTYTVYVTNNHGGFYDGKWTVDFPTKTGYSHELKNQGYTVEYYGGDDYHACVGGYDEGCIHKWIVYK